MRQLPYHPSGGANPPPRPDASGSQRDTLAIILVLATIICLGAAFVVQGQSFLTPGPLSSAHSSIAACSSCHAKSGSDALSWVAGLVPRDRLADSKACLTCHKIPDPVFNAHGATDAVLQQSTQRLTEVAAQTPVPISGHAQTIAFPTAPIEAAGLACATCHQEHNGANVSLDRISNEQCRSCHVVKFDSFDGAHPKFENYPFERRTRIIYDHASHFGKHYPELAKKDPSKPIPATCSTCHDSKADKRVMGLAPFEKTCAACHLDQITGKERVSGPKGIAFLTLPGLDLQTLKKKKAAIGEWPTDSEAGLTPFMKVLLSRSEKGKAIVKKLESVNLQDLSGAKDDQIRAVTDLVWETKGLYHALLKGKASDVLGDLDRSVAGVPGVTRMADLTASIPRDVVASAQQQWLPNLGQEMADRQSPGGAKPVRGAPITSDVGRVAPAADAAPSGANARATGKQVPPQPAEKPPEKVDSADATKAPAGDPPTAAAAEPPAPKPAVPNPQDCLVRVFGECVVAKPPGPAASGDTRPPGSARLAPPAGPSSPSLGLAPPSRLTPPMRVGVGAEAGGATRAAGGADAAAAPTKLAQGQPPAQGDDLLFPTEEELRAIRPGKNVDRLRKAAPGPAKGAPAPDATTSSAAPTAATQANDSSAQPTGQVAVGIASSLEPENWAEHGGWYRQDFAIFYRPTGHKDKLLSSWLSLTGPQAAKGNKAPATGVFDALTHADAPGACTKCHSVDETAGKGRAVNFSPVTADHKKGRFSSFIHEPHFGTMDSKGCMTCHEMEKTGTYLKSYGQGNPLQFNSNFGQIKKELCQTCHNTSQVRQDCLTCHTYHVNGVVTPILNTKIPGE